MQAKKYITLVGDFETTVYKGQQRTDVWASAIVELYTEDVVILGSIFDTYEYLDNLNQNIVIYYHNLKFDGNFWLYYLLCVKKFIHAFTQNGRQDEKHMPKESFNYVISDRGQWYLISIKTKKGKIIEIRDSLKLLPFSVKEIGKSFGTKHRKLEMDYTGIRYPNCYISPEEKEYIKNDALVVKEALEIMFDDGYKSLTIGACCLKEYKNTLLFKEDFDRFFPNLKNFHLEKIKYNAVDADEYIRHSYRGGWCYVVKGKDKKVLENGVTADVNSLYPSMMHSESGNYYPVGEPIFWKGNRIPEEALKNNNYYFLRIKTRFNIKKNKLPFIQIKNQYRFKATEMLETSDYYDKNTDAYYREYKDRYGNIYDTRVEMTLTMTDYILMREHYDLEDFEIIDGCYFRTEIGLFDDYINKYKEIKMTSKGAKRTEAKLFLNNLYGKHASSDDSSYKTIFEEDNIIKFCNIEEHKKKIGYIPVGSAITSYARNFTIRAAQANFYGVDKKGFVYADTDSIHCDLLSKELKAIKVDDNAFCCWKLESFWDKAYFTRQKTYIEHVTHENREKIDAPYNEIKCAGMPQKCKDLLDISLHGIDINNMTEEELKFVESKETIKIEKLNDIEKEFLSVKRSYEDFDIGLRVPSKLFPKRIIGGIVLVEDWYTMH